MRFKKVLVSHAEPKDPKSPYFKLAREWKLDLTFQNFVHIEGETVSEFRKQNIVPTDFSAVIFTGKHPIDHFFRLCTDLRIEMPPDTRYFCVSEASAKYLHKYITIRKRKLYVAKRAMSDLIELISAKKDEKFLYPCGDMPRPDLIKYLEENKFDFQIARIYQTVSNDLKHLQPNKFDVLCFFSPNSIQALFENFPNFDQGDTLVAVFGKTTTKMAEKAGLRLDIKAPQPEAPSMTMALEKYLRETK